jgi:hypothetical protein
MTPRGERRHYLTKACSTSEGCQKCKLTHLKYKIFIELILQVLLFKYFMHTLQFVQETGTMIGHAWNAAKEIVATNLLW